MEFDQYTPRKPNFLAQGKCDSHLFVIMNSGFSSNHSGVEVHEEEDEESGVLIGSDQARPPRANQTSMLVRMAMRVSRAKWFTFLRRVFHYQNGSRSHLGSNPFNSRDWMLLEFVALVVQICGTLITLSVSKTERPVWPMRIWVVGYDFGCVMNIFILYWRYRHFHLRQGDDGLSVQDLENQRSNEDSRYFLVTQVIISFSHNCVSQPDRILKLPLAIIKGFCMTRPLI